MSVAEPARAPLFVDLQGRAVVVVGGGPVAERRAVSMLDAGALVTVISPWATEPLQRRAQAGFLSWQQREFEPGDTHLAWLVHACTGDRITDDAVVAEAESRRIWSVRADDATRSPAWSATSIRSDDNVQLAVSGGNDPRRAQRLRDAVADLVAAGELPMRRQRTGPGRVFLVGAGPGDPDLLTVRARRLLALADVIVTDRLVPAAVLREFATRDPSVEIVDVGKAPGRHALPQEEINELLVRRAQDGAQVVRLKGGDPFVLGRGGEETLACLAANVPVEMVPGITSAVAVPGAAGIPVTHRGVATSMLMLSAHDGADEVIRRAGATPPDTTLVILMGVRQLAATAAALIAAGRPANLPAAVISEGWTTDQRTVIATLATIGDAAADLPAPAVVVIGDVAALGSSIGEIARISVTAGHPEWQ